MKKKQAPPLTEAEKARLAEVEAFHKRANAALEPMRAAAREGGRGAYRRTYNEKFALFAQTMERREAHESAQYVATLAMVEANALAQQRAQAHLANALPEWAALVEYSKKLSERATKK